MSWMAFFQLMHFSVKMVKGHSHQCKVKIGSYHDAKYTEYTVPRSWQYLNQWLNEASFLKQNNSFSVLTAWNKSRSFRGASTPLLQLVANCTAVWSCDSEIGDRSRDGRTSRYIGGRWCLPLSRLRIGSTRWMWTASATPRRNQLASWWSMVTLALEKWWLLNCIWCPMGEVFLWCSAVLFLTTHSVSPTYLASQSAQSIW